MGFHVLMYRSSGGPVDTGPEYQQDLERELFKLKQMYGKADMNAFPDFKFEGKFFSHGFVLVEIVLGGKYVYLFGYLRGYLSVRHGFSRPGVCAWEPPAECLPWV